MTTWVFSLVLTFSTFGGGGEMYARPEFSTEALCRGTRVSALRMLGAGRDSWQSTVQEVFKSEDGTEFTLTQCREEPTRR